MLIAFTVVGRDTHKDVRVKSLVAAPDMADATDLWRSQFFPPRFAFEEARLALRLELSDEARDVLDSLTRPAVFLTEDLP